MMVDSQGRLFGRLNLVDGLVLLFLLSLAATGVYAMGIVSQRSLQITSVEPKRITAGPGRYLMIKGTGFDPSTTVQVGYHPPRSGFFDESTVGIEIDGEIGRGTHGVVVRDGRGRCVVQPDAVEVIWRPSISEVKPKKIYDKGPGSRIKIFGSFFTSNCVVRAGEQTLKVTHANSQEIFAEIGDESSLPLGKQPVTVINEGGESSTIEEGVTVLPAPEVVSVTPNRIPVGDTVVLLIRGKNLREGTRVWFSAQRYIGEAEFVSPECLRIQMTVRDDMRRLNDLFLEIPDGPHVRAYTGAVDVENTFRVFVIAAVRLDERSRGAMEKLKETLDWRARRPNRLFHYVEKSRNFNVEYPLIEVLLPARLRIEEGELLAADIHHRPLRNGGSVDFTINGMELSGTIVGGPFVIFADDFFLDKKSY